MDDTFPSPPALSHGERGIDVSVNLQCQASILFDVEGFIRDVLRVTGILSGSFEFSFVGSEEMRVMNRDYLEHDYVTDILTFNLGTTEAIEGDVYICVDQAAVNATEFGQSLEDELRLLIVHGILHLLGYEDYTDSEKAVMDAEQVRVLREVLHG